MPKPQEFYLTVIDFFGILVPGATLVFLYAPAATSKFRLPITADAPAQWGAFLVASYVFGQLLLGIGVWLNPLARRLIRARLYPFYDMALKAKYDPKPVPNKRQSIDQLFYEVYAVLRLGNAPALAEVEGNMADYKLFRSLVLVSALDIALFSWFAGDWSPSRLVLAAVLLVLTAYRFGFLLFWTYRTAFEYYVLLGGHQVLNRAAAENKTTTES